MVAGAWYCVCLWDRPSNGFRAHLAGRRWEPCRSFKSFRDPLVLHQCQLVDLLADLCRFVDAAMSSPCLGFSQTYPWASTFAGASVLFILTVESLCRPVLFR